MRADWLPAPGAPPLEGAPRPQGGRGAGKSARRPGPSPVVLGPAAGDRLGSPKRSSGLQRLQSARAIGVPPRFSSSRGPGSNPNFPARGRPCNPAEPPPARSRAPHDFLEPYRPRRDRTPAPPLTPRTPPAWTSTLAGKRAAPRCTPAPRGCPHRCCCSCCFLGYPCPAAQVSAGCVKRTACHRALSQLPRVECTGPRPSARGGPVLGGQVCGTPPRVPRPACPNPVGWPRAPAAEPMSRWSGAS